MSKFKSMIRIHYDGDIIENHQIPMRTLGKCISHMQSAVDRAYLDIKHDGIWKHARMAPDDYTKTEYFAQTPEEGGYILDFFSKVKESMQITDRVSSAISEVIKQTSSEITSFKDQFNLRRQQILQNILTPITFQEMLESPTNEVVRKYGDRSIGKEIDQVLTTIRSDYAGDSTFELSITGSSTKIYSFDKHKSKKFHEAVSRRSIGVPVTFKGTLEELSLKNKRGKFKNTANNKSCILHLNDDNDFLKLHPFFIPNKEIEFIGCPLIEFGALEPNSGDIYFIDTIEKEQEAEFLSEY